MMKWVTGISRKVSLEAAIGEVVEQVKGGLGKLSADLGFLFVSHAFASEFPRVLPLLQEKFPIPHLIGCGGSGVIGNGQELELEPGITLLVGHLPGVFLRTFHLNPDRLPDLDSPPQAWQELIGIGGTEQPGFVLLVDGFSFPITDFLQGLDFAYPQSVKVGGLASGGGQGSNALFCGRYLYNRGAVGAAFWGDIRLDAIVAQGCRPIGDLLQVTACERNIVTKLNDRPALDVLQQIVNRLSDRDRRLAQRSLFVGIVMNEFRTEVKQGDFLIRNIIGVDPGSGAIAIGDRIRPGQRLQLHLRDADTSAEDLQNALKQYPYPNPRGALMFSCTGRGEGLYQKPNFDSGLFQQRFGAIDFAGFFCGGEIGPVGGTTFLHGYTSVFGILREP
ncbi:MAG: FIST N-terminal domain-containing protein [Pseudanabaenaceae cyanobacterium SKYGB_i_bin29]|nr:FIST N-terminal domain-containing protein [Pseudanabaenaceae cyanobacterium SKYGB_i_bin29]